MGLWYYKGRMPTPVVLPGRGSVAIVPKSKFEAPEDAVHHLVRAGLVVPVATKDPEKRPEDTGVRAELPPVVQPAPEASKSEAPKEENEIIAVDGQDLVQDVVGSASQAAPVEEAEAGSDGGLPPSPETEKQSSDAPRRKRRR